VRLISLNNAYQKAATRECERLGEEFTGKRSELHPRELLTRRAGEDVPILNFPPDRTASRERPKSRGQPPASRPIAERDERTSGYGSLPDIEGERRSAEVTASTLYEAVAPGLAAIRGHDWAAEMPEGLNMVDVSVSEVAVTHSVRLRDFTVRAG
jgi:hypothetical protein